VEISFGSVDRAVVFGAEVTGLGFDLVEISYGSDARSVVFGADGMGAI
jgi:hypothetical protein